MPPVFSALRPLRWVAHLVTGYKLLALVLSGILVKGHYDHHQIHDMNRVRNLASYLSLAGDPLLLAADGRVDVFIFVRTGEIEGQDDLQVYGSKATGLQPTLEEMLAGDYRNFAYERFRGEVSPTTPNVPLLWDKQSRRAYGAVGRIVGFTGGRTKFLEEAELQALLCRPGQADLPEGP